MAPDNLKIGLTFSGGGYRAACFNLGVLTYLDQVKIQERQLLQCVMVLSTVSGGTITGLRYAAGIKEGEDLKQIFQALYSFMTGTDLVGEALDRLTSGAGWDKGRVKSLINAVADVYDTRLFHQKKFGVLTAADHPIHLKHLSFNATEFANAVQFRFQHSEKMIRPEEGEQERGIIGNYYYRVSQEAAAEIRLADILAASSSFPGGFEPINFPTDFCLPEGLKKSIASTGKYPVGLMDGGIVDNQGISPVLLAENRIRRNLIASGSEPDGKALDLLIVSDVASPYMEAFRASRQRIRYQWQAMSPRSILSANAVLLLCSLAFLIFSLWEGMAWGAAIGGFVLALTLAVFSGGYLLKGLPGKFQVPHHFLKHLRKLSKLQLFVYDSLVLNRINSLVKMTGEVFLKHIRRLNYQTIFNDNEWRNRRIMNAIYELQDEETRIIGKIKTGLLPLALYPTSAILATAYKAASVGTTLWFTSRELKNDPVTGQNYPDAVIACGQFTMCWNLLEYIEKIKKNGQNTTECHQALIACEEQLLQHWQAFKQDPYWLVKKFKDDTGIFRVPETHSSL